MRTNTIEVDQLVSTLSARGVERQLAALPGVQHVDVNYVAGSATVHYDETQSLLESLLKRVIACGCHCSGELVQAHICDAADYKPRTEGHVTSDKPAAEGSVAAGMPAPFAKRAHAAHAGHGSHRAEGEAPVHEMDETAQDMGHALGTSMHTTNFGRQLSRRAGPQDGRCLRTSSDIEADSRRRQKTIKLGSKRWALQRTVAKCPLLKSLLHKDIPS